MHVRLGVNVDHVATLRQARLGIYPDPVEAALIAQDAGCHSITVHLREDKRHIQNFDVKSLKERLNIPLNLEMSTNPDIIEFAKDLEPSHLCIVPEHREELTTEGGMNVSKNFCKLLDLVKNFKNNKTIKSIFIEPSIDDIKLAKELGFEAIEIHTGPYADGLEGELDRIRNAVYYANSLGMIVNAGHGLNYTNTYNIAVINGIKELNIGHSIISRSIFVGIHNAVTEMLEVIS